MGRREGDIRIVRADENGVRGTEILLSHGVRGIGERIRPYCLSAPASTGADGFPAGWSGTRWSGRFRDAGIRHGAWRRLGDRPEGRLSAEGCMGFRWSRRPCLNWARHRRSAASGGEFGLKGRSNMPSGGLLASEVWYSTNRDSLTLRFIRRTRRVDVEAEARITTSSAASYKWMRRNIAVTINQLRHGLGD